MTNIESLPDEVLEFILSLIPPYKDLHDCMCVSKRWKRCVLNVTRTKKRNLHKSIAEFDVRWFTLTPADMAPTISRRYSHTAAVFENSMYVFGGCTCAMTTFNDLWRLDLSKRQWIRPLAMGTYPSPKACSSMVCYNDSLVLFGGWTYPPSYPLYQSWHLFNELHLYEIIKNKWTCVNTLNTPPPMAGHSASVIGKWMVIFGGLHKPWSAVHCEKTNDVWRLNLENWTWEQPEFEFGPKPSGRFGQTQVVLDDHHLFVIGGSGGSNANYGDAWLLRMSDSLLWSWTLVEMRGLHNRPSNIWSNPGCKVGDKIIVLNRVNESEVPNCERSPAATYKRMQEDLNNSRLVQANKQLSLDKDDNVNGKRGTLRNRKKLPEGSLNQPGCSNQSSRRDNVVIKNMFHGSGLSLSAFNGPDRHKLAKSEQIKEKRLAHLQQCRDNMQREPISLKENKNTQNHLGLYVLDISHALDPKPYVTWLAPKNMESGPEETILYTLVEGKSELIMFGGIQNDARVPGHSLYLNSQISNSLHFLTAPDYVI